MLLQNFDHECRHHYATCEIPVLRFVTSLVQNIEHGAVNSALSPSIMKEVTLLKKKLHFTSCNSIKKIHDPLLPNGIRCYCPPPSAWHYLFHCTKSIVNILWSEVRSKTFKYLTTISPMWHLVTLSLPPSPKMSYLNDPKHFCYRKLQLHWGLAIRITDSEVVLVL